MSDELPDHVQRAVKAGEQMAAKHKSKATFLKPGVKGVGLGGIILSPEEQFIITPGEPARYKRGVLVELVDKPKARGRAKTQEMNQTEQQRAYELELLRQSGEIVWWMWQPFSLNYGRDTKGRILKYRPDFGWMSKSGEITLEEIKGHWREAARVRTVAAAGVFWMFHFVALVKKKGGGWDREEF
jgi:hypothetical protein